MKTTSTPSLKKIVKSASFCLTILLNLEPFQAQQLLINPSFENDFTNWNDGPITSNIATVINTDAYDGTKSVSYNAVTGYATFYQYVNVTAGKSYTISFWYKSEGDGTDTSILSYYYGSCCSTVNPIYTTISPIQDSFRRSLPSSNSWKKYTATMPAGRGAGVLRVQIKVESSATLARFDDFYAYEAGTLSTIDDNTFRKGIKMNTIVNDELKVFFPEKATINIYAMDGKLILSDRIKEGAINMSSFSKGNYIVVVDNGSSKVSNKIIKK